MVTHSTQEGVQFTLPVTADQSPAGVALNTTPVETRARPHHSFHLELARSPPAQTHSTHTLVFIKLEKCVGRMKFIVRLMSSLLLALVRWQLRINAALLC